MLLFFFLDVLWSSGSMICRREELSRSIVKGFCVRKCSEAETRLSEEVSDFSAGQHAITYFKGNNRGKGPGSGNVHLNIIVF